MRRHTTLLWSVAVAVLISACSSADTAESTTTSRATTTTTTASTTTAAPTTTTEPPPTTLTLEGDLPGPLREAVEAVYNHAIDPAANPAPAGTPRQLRRLIRDLEVTPGTVEASSSLVELEDGQRVAVATVGDDVLILHRPLGGEPWRPVAAMFEGKDPWLGPESHRSVLVLGSDARVGEPQRRMRADSIHILSLVPATGDGAFVGFPRDSWIGGRKLTDHMPQIGPRGMVDLIEDITSLDLEGYVIVGFRGFLGLMEELGPLEIDLPRPMRSGNSWDDYPEGPQELSPQKALRLARIRKGLPAGDLDRSYNQGLIALAALRMVRRQGIEELPRWVKAIDDHAYTNLSTVDLIRLAAAAYVARPKTIVNTVVPARTGSVGAASVVFINDSAEEVYRDLEDGVLDED